MHLESTVRLLCRIHWASRQVDRLLQETFFPHSLLYVILLTGDTHRDGAPTLMRRLEYIKDQLCELERMAFAYPELQYFIAMAAIDTAEALSSVKEGRLELHPPVEDLRDCSP